MTRLISHRLASSPLFACLLLASCSDPSTSKGPLLTDRTWFEVARSRLPSIAPASIRASADELIIAPASSRAPVVSISRSEPSLLRARISGIDLVIQREGARAAHVRSTDSAVLVDDAAPDVDAALFSLGDRVEELLYVQSRRATPSYRFQLPTGFRLQQSHERVAVVDVLDASGRPLLRMAAPKLWDHAGGEHPVAMTIEGDRVRLAAPPDVDFPIVVDPAWLPPDEMQTPRFRHTATLLSNGKVLLAGGAADDSDVTPGLASQPLADAELFDPETYTFEPLPPLATARWGHTATLLQSGQVLIAGGFDENSAPLASAELFDPVSQSFKEGGAMTHARGLATATRLDDGRVLYVGGTDDLSTRQPVSEAELYDSDTAFEPVEELDAPAFPHAAALLADGRVAAISFNGLNVHVELFDPESKTFTTQPDLPANGLTGNDITAVVDESATSPLGVLGSDGACELNAAATSSVCYLFCCGDALSESSGLGTARAISRIGSDFFGFGALNMSDAEGNVSAADFVLRSSYSLSQWNSMYQALVRRAWATSTTLASDSILVAGGVGPGPDRDVLKSSEVFTSDVAKTQLSDGQLAAIVKRNQATVLLQDGRVLVSGGRMADSDPASSLVYVWNGVDAPTALGGLNATRFAHRTFLLGSGEVLVAGGTTDPVDANEELYDPSAGASKSLDFRLNARGNGVALAHGRILFAGPSGLELVDSASWKVTVVESPVDLECEQPGLVRLPSGRVAVVGRTAVFEIDPTDARSSEPLLLHRARCDAVVAALPDGTVLIAGGTDDADVATRDTELFNPSANSLSVAEKLPTALASGAALTRFQTVYVHSSYASDYNWPTGTWTSGTAPSLSRDGALTLVPSGGWLLTDMLGPSYTTAYTFNGAATKFGYPTSPPHVRAGQHVELTQVPFVAASEGSSGTTAASATNAPVPVWMPAVGGWPVTGSFLKWSTDSATWEVPNTAFPGFGLLFYAVHGELHPLGPVFIEGANNGHACTLGGECDSGYCVDGVCCESACDGACLSCSATTKGGGEDGVCEPTPAGFVDSACADEGVKNCATNGTCDGNGACALYPEGDACGEGAVCTKGVCTVPSEANDAGAPTLCDGDHLVTDSEGEHDCAPYRCALATNECLEECATNRDCAPGNSCNADGTCSSLPALPMGTVGCAPGCRSSANPAREGGLFAPLALALLEVRRRRRSRAARRATSGVAAGRARSGD